MYIELDFISSFILIKVLFIKLFLGSILSFIISWIVFLIPKEEFDSRISLTVGGIFGAIGSSAFVYEVLPVVNVFTKADAIKHAQLIRKTKGAKLDEEIEGLKNK